MKMEIVARLRRIVEKARTGMPSVGVETLLEAADEIQRLREEIGYWEARPRTQTVIPTDPASPTPTRMSLSGEYDAGAAIDMNNLACGLTPYLKP